MVGYIFSHLYYCEEWRNKEILLIYTKYNFEKLKNLHFCHKNSQLALILI